MSEDHPTDIRPDNPAEQAWSQPPQPSSGPAGWSQPPSARPRRLYGSTESARWRANPELQAQAEADAAADAAAEQAASAAARRVFTPEPRSCPKCGGEIDWDGYCVQCGAAAPSGRDHLEDQPASWVAGVCDRGLRHSRNEDAMAIDATPDLGGRAVLVVCDGVSMSTDSDRASMAAAHAVLAHIAGANDWDWELSDLRPESVTTAVLTQTVKAANNAVLANSDLAEPSPASSTLAIAIVNQTQLLSATIGDSRVYWVPDEGQGVLLSTDDSMAQEQIAAGVDRAIAESGMHSHVITRWLGRDAPDLKPTIANLVADRPGWFVACSDGLWNYISEPAVFADLVRAVAAQRPGGPLEISQGLVSWAIAQGGDDNITVAMARIEPQTTRIQPGGPLMPTDPDLDTPTTRTRPVGPAAAS